MASSRVLPRFVSVRVRKAQNQLFIEKLWNLYLIDIAINAKLAQEGEMCETHSNSELFDLDRKALYFSTNFPDRYLCKILDTKV
jgi:hypothetical protein